MADITSYLNFDGNCRVAMTFYAKCLGAELNIIKFSEAPGETPPGAGDRVMHALLSKGSLKLMASDTMPGMPYHPGNNVWLALKCDSIPEIESLFAAFSENAKIVMPLAATFWATRFGMLTDQFGVGWMFNLEAPKPQ